jgi:hypothetical protein
MTTASRQSVLTALERSEGILRLKPAWVARDWLPPGKRLGLAEHEYDVGERGFICERWLASTTHADNRVGPPDEGLSYLDWDGPELTLKDLVDVAPAEVMGQEYAATHSGLGRLAKIFDFSARIPYHIHPRLEHSRLVGRNPKDEAYYFPPDVPMGAHPETFLGIHPYLGAPDRRETLLPYLIAWDSDLILRHAPAYLQVAEEGFFIPSGVLHAPGTALTMELQEDSDTLAMFQALNAGKIISKDLLFKDVRKEDRERYGERFLLEWVDWPTNADPFFYENHHLSPQLIPDSRQPAGEEYWIFYNTRKFIGKKLVVHPRQTYNSREPGVYSLLVWQGEGCIGGVPVQGRQPGRDELLITHGRASKTIAVENTGAEDLLVIKFFGPDIQTDVPVIGLS